GATQRRSYRWPSFAFRMVWLGITGVPAPLRPAPPCPGGPPLLYARVLDRRAGQVGLNAVATSRRRSLPSGLSPARRSLRSPPAVDRCDGAAEEGVGDHRGQADGGDQAGEPGPPLPPAHQATPW